MNTENVNTNSRYEIEYNLVKCTKLNAIIKPRYEVSTSLSAATNFSIQGQRSRSQIKVKGHQNLVTSRVHNNTYFYRVIQFLISSILVFGRTVRQTDKHTHTHTHTQTQTKQDLLCLAWLTHR